MIVLGSVAAGAIFGGCKPMEQLFKVFFGKNLFLPYV